MSRTTVSSQRPSRPGTVRSLALTGARALNVLQGLALAWGVVFIAIVVSGLPGDTAPTTLPGVEVLRPGPTATDAVALADLPVVARLVSSVGTAALFVAVGLALGAAARVARHVGAADPFAPGVASALRTGAVALLVAAVVLPLTRVLSLDQVQAWVGSASPERWGEVTLQTSGVPVGTTLGLLLAAIVLGVLAVAFREGERLRRDTDGLV